MDLLNRLKAWIKAWGPQPIARDNGFQFWLETVERDKREESPKFNSEWVYRQGYGWVRR